MSDAELEAATVKLLQEALLTYLSRLDASEARERALREALRVGEHLRLAGQAYWEEPSALTRSDFEQAAIAWDVAADPLLTEPLEGEL